VPGALFSLEFLLRCGKPACPVCCRPNVIDVEIDEDGDVRVWAAGE
jgi:hypothetical protein